MFILAWAVVLACCLMISRTPTFQIFCVFFLIGTAAGTLQSLAMRASPAPFLLSKSATDVKRALLASKFGKASIAILWLSVAALLWLIWFKTEMASLQTLFGSYASLLLSRELMSLPGVISLAGQKNVR
jgi:hypothetical protein